MMETVLGLACMLCVAVAVIAMVCRQLAFAERDEARMDARRGWATAAAAEQLREEAGAKLAAAEQARDDYKRLWYAGHQSQRDDGHHGPLMIATGPRLCGDERQERSPRNDDED